MFQALKELLESITPLHPTPSPAEHARALQRAAAVLLVEVVRTKATLGDLERSVMESALRQQFALSDEELQALLDQATTTSRTAYDYQHFTSQLNEHFTQAEKIRLSKPCGRWPMQTHGRMRTRCTPSARWRACCM